MRPPDSWVRVTDDAVPPPAILAALTADSRRWASATSWPRRWIYGSETYRAVWLTADEGAGGGRVMSDVRIEDTQHGFRFGAMVVARLFTIDGRVCIEIATDAGKSIQVYASATGRSLRVFGDGEWTGEARHVAKAATGETAGA